MDPFTYPVRPVNGGKLQLAVRKIGEWMYQPKVNGWRTLVHAPTGRMWNRKGEPLSIADCFRPALAELKETGVEWFDCEAFERRHNFARGSLVVLDIIGSLDPEHAFYKQTWRARRECLSIHLGGDRILPHQPTEWDENQVYWLRSYPEESAADMHQRLWEITDYVGFEAYEGLVAWRVDKPYPIQLQDPSRESPWVMKHRWEY